MRQAAIVGSCTIVSALVTLSRMTFAAEAVSTIQSPNSMPAASVSSADWSSDDESSFTPLFNGRDFTGWIGAVDSYEIVDGAIQCRPGMGGNLLTAKQYANFIVRLEFRVPRGGNNGLAIRTPGPDTIPAYDGVEIQVLDDSAEKYATLEPYQYNGSAYGLKAAERGFLRPAGAWNVEELIVDGDRIVVALNGHLILDADLGRLRDAPVDGKKHPGASRTTGHFGFCGHSDPVAFRNIRIKTLEGRK